MKICAIICEYNPFHNGHLYQLNEAKKLSKADAIVCFMSGNFVQRGESALLDKYTRAKHAVLSGADVVIELPTVFATSNAELFARGAIQLISAIPSVKTLAFGAENVDKLAFISASRYLNNEPEEVSKNIKASLALGVSYAKARTQAYAGFIPMDLLCSPNNILGLEYTRALQRKNSDVDILPIQRIGGGYTEETLQPKYSSATAIRKHLEDTTALKDSVPAYVLEDLPSSQEQRILEKIEKYALLSRTSEEIARVCDCSEGLENALKKASQSAEPLETALTSARYTASRIRRIALQNLLQIDETLIRQSLESDLYLRVLAVKENRSDVLSVLSESKSPLIIRAHDENKLNDVAKRCFEKDVFAEKVYSLINSMQMTDKSIFTK